MKQYPLLQYIPWEEAKELLYENEEVFRGNKKITMPRTKHDFFSRVPNPQGEDCAIIFKNQFDMDSFDYGGYEAYKYLADYQKFTDRKKQILKELEK